MSQPEEQSKPDQKISICDIMKEDTSKVIQKFESDAPAKFQEVSDLYTAFLHTMDDVYGTCYISEKEFFDKLNIDQNLLKSMKQYSKAWTDAYTNQIDMFAKYRHNIIQMQINSLAVYDQFMHTMMDSYAKGLASFNKMVNQNSKPANY